MATTPAPAGKAGRATEGAAAGPSAAFTEQKPLWELTLGATSFYGPDYPAADESHVRFLGAPLPIYRGDLFRLGDDDGFVSVVPVDNPRLKLSLSFSGSYNVDSDDNDARQGMPDLDYLGEVGPQLTWHLARTIGTNGSAAAVDLVLPARAVFSASSSLSDVEQRGYRFEPGLQYRRIGTGERPLRFTARLSTMFASQELMDYFYTVRGSETRVGRPRFDASGGYLGSRLQLSLEQPVFDSVSLFLGARVDTYAGAENDGSPLFRDDYGAAASLSIVWSFLQSDRKVVRSRW